MDKFKTMCTNLIAVGFAATLAFGCASNKTEQVSAEKVSKEVVAAAELNRSFVSTIAFSKGKQGLTNSASREIEMALAEARKMGEIKTVEVAVWSDLEYPRTGAQLPKHQVQLANARAKSIEQFIDKASPSSDVKTINMAQQPNAFQKWLDTRDAHVKDKLVSSGVVTTENNVTTAHNRASSALLFIEVK